MSRRQSSFSAPEDVRILLHGGRPALLLAEAKDDISTVFHALILGGITSFPLRILMRWTVNVNSSVVLFIEEVRPGLADLEELLSTGRQVVIVGLQVVEPSLFKLRTAKPLQLDDVFGAW